MPLGVMVILGGLIAAGAFLGANVTFVATGGSAAGYPGGSFTFVYVACAGIVLAGLAAGGVLIALGLRRGRDEEPWP